MVIVGELTGILLAAGQGIRFGGDKGLALLPGGMPMAVCSALNLRAVVPQVICVLRPGDAVLHALLSEQGFEVVVAEDAAQGMSASLRAGIREAPTAEGWMVALADMPLIKQGTYQKLMAAFTAKQKIILPCLTTVGGHLPLQKGGRGGFSFERQEATSGHPVTFPFRFKPDLLALSGDKGAKSILQQHPDAVQRVIVDDPGILQDFDTRQAFNRLFI